MKRRSALQSIYRYSRSAVSRSKELGAREVAVPDLPFLAACGVIRAALAGGNESKYVGSLVDVSARNQYR